MLGEHSVTAMELEVTGWMGMGAAHTTPVHSQGCRALSGIPPSLQEDVGTQGHTHLPLFLLPM